MKKTLLMTFIMTLILTTTAQPLSFSKRDIDANHTKLLAKMINAIQPELNSKAKNRIAKSLYKTAKDYNVDPKLMIAIIGTESDFVNEKVSTTGDLSLAQINTQIWDKEFIRLGLKKLNPKLLKKNELYALGRMAVILNILKSRHAKKDNQWFARYHSQTKKLKNLYSKKVEKRMRMIASIN
ncbi:MAG: transglycosylase SLT domain-containing protein [Bacteriovorax sp.]|nr:transglycosylase SLT domain-containing protein [Bacteriovorax sp.]